MLVIRQKMIYRQDLGENTDILYVFGDNLERYGYGGQAKEMRDEPNAFGIATKRSITHNFPEDYFFDDQDDVIPILKEEFDRLEAELAKKLPIKVEGYGVHLVTKWKAVVIPADGIGTGLSKMPEHAPKALEYIEKRFKRLESL